MNNPKTEKVLARSSANGGMKEGPELEAKKSMEQKNEEMCNFLSSAFCVDGGAEMVEADIALKIPPFYYRLKDSRRGTFRVVIIPEL